MAYMVKEGLADFAITEDSDLVAFGCNKLYLKFTYAAHGDLFDLDQFRNGMDNSKWEESLKAFQAMDHEDFLNTCCMAGCEYIKSIDRVGLKVICKNYIKAKSCM
jgi:exonuclease-1